MENKESIQPEKELTVKIKKFCAIYAMLNDETQAAIKAGYPFECAKATAKRLLKREDVQKRINKEIEKLADKYKVDRADIIAHLKNMLDWDLFNILKIREINITSAKNQISKIKKESENDEDINLNQSLLIDIEKLKELQSQGLTKYIVSISQTKYGIKIEIPRKTEIIDILNKMNGFYQFEDELPNEDKKIELSINMPVNFDAVNIKNNGIELKFNN